MKNYNVLEAKNINKLVVVTLHGTVSSIGRYDSDTGALIPETFMSMPIGTPSLSNGENVRVELLGNGDRSNHYISTIDTILCKPDSSDPELEKRTRGYSIWDTRADIFVKDHVSYDESKALFDKIPSENGVILDIRVVVTGTKDSNKVVTSYRDAGDISVLEKLTEYLNDDAYNSIIQAVNNIFNKKNIVLPEVSAIIKDYYNKVSEATKSKLDNFPVFDTNVTIDNYSDYVKFDRDLKYRSFEKDLLRCIISAIDEMQIRDAVTEDSRTNTVTNMLYAYTITHHMWQTYVRSVYSYSGIFDTNNIYIDPNADFDINEYLEFLKYMRDLYCEYTSTGDDFPVGMSELAVPCTTTERVRIKLSELIYGVLALKTKEFFKSIDIVKEFRDAVEKKLEKHKEPGINMSSCTMDNISSFIEARFNRMDALTTILISCDYYIDLYNKYNHKDFIPVDIASGRASKYMTGFSELSVFLAKICRHLGNGDMYKGLNPILKNMETYKLGKTVDTDNIPNQFIGSYASEILLNDPNRTDVADVMFKAAMISDLCWRVGNNQNIDIMNRLTFKKEFLDKVEEVINQVNVDCNK